MLKCCWKLEKVFKKVAEIMTTRSKWLIAIQLDWHPYYESLKLITVGLNEIQAKLKGEYTKLKPDKNGESSRFNLCKNSYTCICIYLPAPFKHLLPTCRKYKFLVDLQYIFYTIEDLHKCSDRYLLLQICDSAITVKLLIAAEFMNLLPHKLENFVTDFMV